MQRPGSSRFSLTMPSDLLPMSPVYSVTYLSGLDRHVGSPQWAKHGSFVCTHELIRGGDLRARSDHKK